AIRGAEPSRRLVGEEPPGWGDGRGGVLEPPPLAAAVAPGRPVEQVGEAERRRQLGDPWLDLALCDAPEPRVQLEVAPAAERPVDDRFLEDDAARAPRLDRRVSDIAAADERGARPGHDR